MDSEPGEISLGETTVDLTKPQERTLGETIKIDGDQIGASKWEEMLSLTASNGKERELSVALRRGKLINGKISEGTETGSTTPVGITDLLPESLSGRKITRIHTHPGEKHLPNDVFSDGDIQSFSRSSLGAFVMIEKGGAHLLIKTRKQLEEQSIPGDLEKKRRREIEKTTGLVADVIRLTAGDLEQYGIGYYFSPDVSSTPGPKTFYKAKNYFVKS